jgi:hypothetical protein
MITNGAELKLNRDNTCALVMAMTVVFVIISFTIYFNDLSLNQAWSVQQQKDKRLAVSGVHSLELQFDKKLY